MAEVAERGASATITYTDLAERIGVMPYRPYGEAFTDLLCDISRATLNEGKGLLSAVVVRDDRGYPGDGFFEFLRELGRLDVSGRDFSDDEKRAAWAAEREILARVWPSGV